MYYYSRFLLLLQDRSMKALNVHTPSQVCPEAHILGKCRPGRVGCQGPAQSVKALAAKPGYLIWDLKCMWWEERIKSCRLSPRLHMGVTQHPVCAAMHFK